MKTRPDNSRVNKTGQLQKLTTVAVILCLPGNGRRDVRTLLHTV
jgi:hypothetical protein